MYMMLPILSVELYKYMQASGSNPPKYVQITFYRSLMWEVDLQPKKSIFGSCLVSSRTNPYQFTSPYASLLSRGISVVAAGSVAAKPILCH